MPLNTTVDAPGIADTDAGSSPWDDAGEVPAKVFKIETGKQAPSQDDLVAWCDLTDSGLALPDLLGTLTNLESMWAEWKRITAGGHARRQHRSVEIEAAARSIRTGSRATVAAVRFSRSCR
ncbi:hypothetical protein AB4305_17255 [Nocardia sp. 2YAB30]|uniref:hypothetical protein n=1 Tax=unclassified Nocardia TaxID=2637762 RepID=UPI003F9DB49F